MDQHDAFGGKTGAAEDRDPWQIGGGAPAAITTPLVATARSPAARLLRLSRKIGVALLGGLVLVLGVALIFLPGPAVVVIPLGLAVLGTEFPWAQRLQRYMKARAASALQLAKRAIPGPLGSALKGK
jgi:hypothetical protein